MRRELVVIPSLVVLLAVAGSPAAMAEGPEPVGAIVGVKGSVQVGRDGAWLDAKPATPLFDGQTIRTVAGASAEVLFEGDLKARLDEKTEIAVADLLLKARLEKLRSKIAAPQGSVKADIKVTPLTGVRGTEQTEQKAEDLKREHYWNENAPDAK